MMALSPPIDFICGIIKILIPPIRIVDERGKPYPVDCLLVQVSNHIPQYVSFWCLYEYRSLPHKSELQHVLENGIDQLGCVILHAFGLISIIVTASSSLVCLSLCPASLILRIELQD